MKSTSPCSIHHRRESESGNVLAAVYLSIVPIIGMIAAFHLRTDVEMKIHQGRKDEIRATQRAFAALEVARNVVTNSPYTSSNNDAIQNALDDLSLGSLMNGEAYFGGQEAFVGLDVLTGLKVPIQEPTSLPSNVRPYKNLLTIDLEDDQDGEADDDIDKVDVYVVNLTGLWHMLEARARVGSTFRTARMLVRERDPFTRFSIFIDNHYQGIAGNPKGDIHTNRTLQLFFPDGKYDDYVSARDGFQWLVGANSSNTTFQSGYSAPSSAITMPDINDIQGIQPFAQAPFYIGEEFDNVIIDFQGEDVTIRGRRISTGVTETIHVGALPSNGVIYSENSIVGLGGDVNGRVTIACEENVTITNSIRYVDAQGDPAMLGSTTPSTYQQNPEYQGSSAVGIVANGPVLYDHSIPNSFELHAAIFSSQGNVGLPGITFTSNGAYALGYDPTFQKQNLCTLGCTVADKRFVGSVIDWYGNLLSGFQAGAIEYDRNLLNNPPPHFLEIDRPMFMGIEILENVVDT